MFFVLSKTLDLLLSPLTWAALMVVAARPWRRERSSRQVTLGLLGLCCLWFFSIPIVAGSLQAFSENSARHTYRSEHVYDVVIILGGALDGGRTSEHGQVSWNDNSERLMTGFSLLREGRARRAIVTGAEVWGRGSDAQQMKAQLVAWGIDEHRVLVQDRSRNTHEDALYVRELLGTSPQSLLLVTSAYHMLRSDECFAAQGLSPDLLPVDYRGQRRQSLTPLPRADHLATSTRTLRELFGRLVYRARGYAMARPIVPRD